MSTKCRPSVASSVSTSCSELLQEVGRRGVDERMHGVETEAIEMIVAQPHDGVVAEEPAHLVAAGRVEIDGVSPGRVVAIG